MNDNEIEQALVLKGKTAPRVTPALIDSKIVDARFWNPEGTSLTICVLQLENGFLVTGESASASIENFDPEIGKKIASDKAREKIWALEGYLLRQCLHEASQ